MSKRISSVMGSFSAQVAGENMRKYISEKGLTRKKMAEMCDGLDRRTISDIAAGKDKAYNASTFEVISKFTGIGSSYWKGLTAVPLTLEQEKDNQRAAFLMSEIEKKQHRDMLLRYNNLRTFFSICGYDYELSEDTAGEPQILHHLTKGDSTIFAEADMETLLSKIAELIDFECYRQRKRTPSN